MPIPEVPLSGEVGGSGRDPRSASHCSEKLKLVQIFAAWIFHLFLSNDGEGLRSTVAFCFTVE
jgi:hypothetical protein